MSARLSLALDADRVARFTREAQVLASLNHPNIAQVFGVEERGATRALVMESARTGNVMIRATTVVKPVPSPSAKCPLDEGPRRAVRPRCRPDEDWESSGRRPLAS